MERISFCVVVVLFACSGSVSNEALNPIPPIPPLVERPIELPPVQPLPLPQAQPASEPPVVVRQVKSRSAEECEWFTKISANEVGFNIEEAKKIRQTLENMRRPGDSLLDAMYRQAARVTRQKPFTDTRQIWTSYLPMKGDGPPEKGWIECTGKEPTPKGCTGRWKTVVERWVPFREEAAKLYYSGIVPNVLPGKPIQWGGDMDYWRGAGRNFCPLNVGDRDHNTFWGDPRDPANNGACLAVDEEKVKTSKVLMAHIASGREKRKHLIPIILGDSLVPPLRTEAENDTPSVD